MNDKAPCMRLADGRIVALPTPPDLGEFTLAGNVTIYPGVVALYDETTRTGATFAGGTWYMQQPVTREQFNAHCALFWQAVAAIDVAANEIRY